jgi:DNA-3-methyladenine glycosylase
MKLTSSFYNRDDVVQISRDLLGKVLCTNLAGGITRAIITETEAYAGVDDRASHAYGGRRTKRTEPMFAVGGTAYVYLCYGIHHLFNVVTGAVDTPHAILLRAGKPLQGTAIMLQRRGKSREDQSLLAGPGSLAKAMGITTALSGQSLLDNQVWIENHQFVVADSEITSGPRVGVGYAQEDASRPYRFICVQSFPDVLSNSD